jgi:hypothetical protein
MTDDPLRYETPDGESPSRYGAFAAIPALCGGILAATFLAALAWAISRAIG